MLQIVLFTSLFTIGTVSGPLAPACREPSNAAAADSLRAMYESGQPFGEFLQAAVGRKELWHSNYERSVVVDSALLAKVRAIPGPWRILAVAVDGCSDSVNTLPYIARLAELVDGLDVRIVNSTAGRSIMEAHPTPDGRAATPTFLLLDANWNKVGCFIERPPALVQFMQENKDKPANQLQSSKMEWYADDAGRQTLQQLLVMLQGAAEGKTVCR
jgi:hypothetical protein